MMKLSHLITLLLLLPTPTLAQQDSKPNEALFCQLPDFGPEIPRFRIFPAPKFSWIYQDNSFTIIDHTEHRVIFKFYNIPCIVVTKEVPEEKTL